MTSQPTKASQIQQLLRAGKSVRETTELLATDEGYVRSIANKHNLPTNRPIPPGGRLEKNILISLVVLGFTGDVRTRQDVIRDVAHLYGQVPDHIWDVINRKSLS